MKAASVLLAPALLVLPLAGCGKSLGQQRVDACSARAKAAVLPAGFEVVEAHDTGDPGAGGMAVVYFYTGNGGGGSAKKMATCFFPSRSAAISFGSTVDVADTGPAEAAAAEVDNSEAAAVAGARAAVDNAPARPSEPGCGPGSGPRC